jgi:hypothetical protein
MKLTPAQRKALSFARDNIVELFQNGNAFWPWFGKLPNGATVKVAGNATIATLIERGLMRYSVYEPRDRRVSITPEGRRALASPTKAQADMEKDDG